MSLSHEERLAASQSTPSPEVTTAPDQSMDAPVTQTNRIEGTVIRHDIDTDAHAPGLYSESNSTNDRKGASASKKRMALILGGAAAAVTGAVGFAMGSRGGDSEPATLDRAPVAAAPAPEANNGPSPELVPGRQSPSEEIVISEEAEGFVETRQRNIIQLVDVENLSANLTAEVDSEALQTTLDAIGENMTYGYNNDSFAHIQLGISSQDELAAAAAVFNDVNRIKATTDSGFTYGYRYEALGDYEILADGSIVVDVEEFRNNRDLLDQTQWESLRVSLVRFAKADIVIQTPDGEETVSVWKFANRLSR